MTGPGLDEKTLHQINVLDPSKLRDAPDSEAVYEVYRNIRRAVEVFPWGVFMKDVVRRDNETGDVRHVRVTVDETYEYDVGLQHECVDFDWAPDTNAPGLLAHVTSNNPGVWRRGWKTHPEGAYAARGDRGGQYRPRPQRRNRSRSALLGRAIEATWPTRASPSEAVAMSGSARVRDVCLRAPRWAPPSPVAHAWV